MFAQIAESLNILWYVIPGTLILGLLYDFVRYKTLSRTLLKDKHVVVTGGSSGIGKSFACEAARRGANVTLLARDKEKLRAAELEVKKCCIYATQRVFSYSVDVCGTYEKIEDTFVEVEKDGGPIFMLMNCAGAAVCGVLEKTTPSDIRKMLDLNCIGSILPTRAVIEGMKSRGEGHVIFTSSEAGLVGIYGLSSYSASKYALRGFAEALQMEVQHYRIRVTVAYPPDTDTPGFAEEEKSKPKETRLICQSSGLFKPDEVALKIMNDALPHQKGKKIASGLTQLIRVCPHFIITTQQVQKGSVSHITLISQMVKKLLRWHFIEHAILLSRMLPLSHDTRSGTDTFEQAGSFMSSLGLDGFMLTTLNAGMTSESSVARLIGQVFLMGLMRVLAVFYRISFDRIIKKCKDERNLSKKAE